MKKLLIINIVLFLIMIIFALLMFNFNWISQLIEMIILLVVELIWIIILSIICTKVTSA